MTWTRFAAQNTLVVSRPGRGLSGMNMDAIKTTAATVTENARQFGTELSSNIIDNQHHRLAKKRRFDQFQSEEQKDEEVPDEDREGEMHPNKRRRYNLRSQGITRTQTEKENQTSKTTNVNLRLNVTGSKMTDKVMEAQTMKTRSPSESGDEDIDLDSSDRTKYEEGDAQRRPTSKLNVRRSQRLQKKRERRLQQNPEGAIKVMPINSTMSKPIPKAEIVVEKELMDCDAAKKDDDLYAPTYARDICEWFKKLENAEFQQSLIKNNYISTRFQPDLNESMRLILLNWLFNVQRRFQLKNRVIYLTVYILDAYLSRVPVRRSELQLVGCTALWISSKYHEIYAPEVADFVFISDHSFEIEDLFSTEVLILVQLEFKFSDIMTPLHFLERNLQIASFPLLKKYEARGTAKALKDGKRYVALVTQLSNFFSHLILFDCKTVSTKKPSCIAAAAICFTVLGISLYSQWPEYLVEATGYQHHELKPVLQRMNELRKAHVNKNSKKEKGFGALKKVHSSIQKWLDRLNVVSVLNNGPQKE